MHAVVDAVSTGCRGQYTYIYMYICIYIYMHTPTYMYIHACMHTYSLGLVLLFLGQ